MPGVLAACAEAGVALPDARRASSSASGPGPFTGLRVGMVTAAALGDALGVPVHGVCSLDAIAADAVDERDRAAARWSSPTPAAARSTGPPTTGGARISGPHVEAPAALRRPDPRAGRAWRPPAPARA